MTPHSDDRPIDLAEAPAEEDVSKADIAERLDKDPEDQVNRTDGDPGASGDDKDA